MFEAGQISWISFSYARQLFDRDSAWLTGAFIAVYTPDDSGSFSCCYSLPGFISEAVKL